MIIKHDKTSSMKYKTLSDYKEEPHPWDPFIPESANKLLLGTFPTIEANRKICEFYYPNPNNDFWVMLFNLTNKNMDDYENADPIQIRKQILSELQLGIADMGKKILRQKNSSKDSYLFPVEYTDIFSLLDEHPKLQKIILTSSSGANSVASWFHHYCELNNKEFKIPTGKLPKRTFISLGHREIIIDIIPSTSRLSPIKGNKLFEIYKGAILKM